MASLVKTVEMRVLAKAGDAQAKLDELAAKGDKLQSDGIKMRFRVEDGEGKAQLDAIKARADALGFKDVSIKVRVDGKGRAIADLEAIKHEADKVSGGGILSKLGGGISGLFGSAGGAAGNIPVVGGVAGAGGGVGLAVVVPALAALLQEVVAVGSGFAAAGAGAGAFALLALPAIDKVKKALADISKGKSLSALHLTVDEKSAVAGIEKLKAAFGRISTAFQPQAFKIFNDALKVANNLLPHLTQFATPFAAALDGLLQKLGKFTASKGFSDWLKQFSALVGPAVTSIGQGIGNVANAFGKLMTTMSGKDVAHAINIAFDGLAGTIRGIAAAVSFMMRAWDGIKPWAHNVASSFDSIRGAAGKLASGVASTFSEAGHAIASWVSSVGHYVADVIKVFTALPGKIRAVFAGAAGWLVGAGKAIIEGLVHGIESMAGAAVSAAEHVGSAMISKVKSILHIGSPSRVFQEIGGWTIQGLILGLHANLPLVEKMAAQAAKVLSDRFKAEMALAKNVSGATLSGLGLTSIDLSSTTVAGGMQSYLASIKAFIAEIKQLTSMHLNKGILQQLIAAGPVTGGQYAQNILQGGVGPVNSLYKQIQQQSALLGAQAAMSLYGGKVSPKGDTFNITVSAGLITDKQQIALEIVKLLRSYKRQGGGASLGLG